MGIKFGKLSNDSVENVDEKDAYNSLGINLSSIYEDADNEREIEHLLEDTGFQEAVDNMYVALSSSIVTDRVIEEFWNREEPPPPSTTERVIGAVKGGYEKGKEALRAAGTAVKDTVVNNPKAAMAIGGAAALGAGALAARKLMMKKRAAAAAAKK
jgi:hypothetical protein